MNHEEKKSILFPDQLAGATDLARLIRELSDLHESLHQATIRAPGSNVQLPKTSKVLEELASLNKVSLLDAAQREQLIKLLKAFHDRAPIIHISFATEPSSNFIRNLVTWMRKNISPIVLIEIGLQPTITAGCVVRTTNKYFDFSLRNRFVEKRPVLVEKLSEVGR